MIPRCGCCEGIRQLTPGDTANRPGLSAILYRVGTHSSFLETMKARLSSWPLDQPVVDRCLGTLTSFPLVGLSTRQGYDFSIAILDAWALVADVLTFYQERIVNEGYLRTAMERYSVVELARLIGYEPRPGVASSVFLAYTIEKDHAVDIPVGSRAQSTPGPGELPQSFETSAVLKSRDLWNNLKLRKTKPQQLSRTAQFVYFKGVTTNLKPNDRLLFEFSPTDLVPRRVCAVEPDNDNDWTKVVLELEKVAKPLPAVATASATPTTPAPPPPKPKEQLDAITKALAGLLSKKPAAHPNDPSLLVRDVKTAFAPTSDVLPRLMSTLKPELGDMLYTALENLDDSEPPSVNVHALRVRASPFGHNAPKKQVFGLNNQVLEPVEWPLSRLAPSDSQQQFSLKAELKPGGTAGLASSLENVSMFKLPSLMLHTEISIAGVKQALQDISLKDGTFNLDSTGKIKVQIQVQPFQLVYDFQIPPLGITITANENEAKVVGAGTNPTTTIFGRTSSDISWRVEGQMPGSVAHHTEETNKISLDTVQDKIVPGGWILLEGPGKSIVSRVEVSRERSRADYGISGKLTEITLEAGKTWLDLDLAQKPDLSAVRDIAIFAQSEKLKLAEEPLEEPVDGARIELDGVYDGLESGRWLIVSGERKDLKGVPAAELIMLAGSELDTRADIPTDQMHTFLNIADKGLAYTYKRESVSIYGNVAQGSHGETRSEVLGSGDASKSLQEFQLKQFPLTYTSAETPSGIEDTLTVRVNEIRWHEAHDLASLGPNDRSFLTRTGNDSKTTVVFGNGVHGARVPTGIENITAVYRTGIGKAGNVGAGQIKMLTSKPLGVKDVINPIRASGGAGPESRDAARRNAPLAVMSLDRLVSVQDYADFARTFAGIAKASAMQIGTSIQVTIVGADNSPIDESSKLFGNLLGAFQSLGDPQQFIELIVCKPMFLVIQANVAVFPDYQFETIAPKIRSKLLVDLGFDNRDLGQGVVKSEIVTAIQSIEGVRYVDLDVFAIAEDLSVTKSSGVKILPGQLAVLTPDLPETLILRELNNA